MSLPPVLTKPDAATAPPDSKVEGAPATKPKDEGESDAKPKAA